MELFLGLITGILFGFFLQKAEVLRFEKQVRFMLLKDLTIIKFMGTAVLVGMVGITALNQMGVIALSLKATNVAAIIMGGLLFGVGWAVAGFCPGTAVGALAEGRMHALWALLGMLFGAAAYAEAYPVLAKTVLTWGDYGKLTLPQVLGVSPWLIIAAFVAGMLLLFWQAERKGL
ncbi:MAG: YeeE/YedE family protein [Desulfuromonadaceae bacterium]|nr:YeeE/YedE family protein [Desulfuromonadaceae bacterium]